jgi:hypothetical protein
MKEKGHVRSTRKQRISRRKKIRRSIRKGEHRNEKMRVEEGSDRRRTGKEEALRY